MTHLLSMDLSWAVWLSICTVEMVVGAQLPVIQEPAIWQKSHAAHIA